MTNDEIKLEHDRLRPILFEGAPDWCEYARVNRRSLCWEWLNKHPDDECDGYLTATIDVITLVCTNQPDTSLDWYQTLIFKGYE